jgi:hypothetical protein
MGGEQETLALDGTARHLSQGAVAPFLHNSQLLADSYHSYKSLSSIGEKISHALRAYYTTKGLEPPYAISRNRVIEQLMQLKNQG